MGIGAAKPHGLPVARNGHLQVISFADSLSNLSFQAAAGNPKLEAKLKK